MRDTDVTIRKKGIQLVVTLKEVNLLASSSKYYLFIFLRKDKSLVISIILFVRYSSEVG